MRKQEVDTTFRYKKPETETPLGTYKHRCDDNIKVDLKEKASEYGLHSSR
jgi:hypothetical protein